MDEWRYRTITHTDHVVCNPTSPERLDELIELLDLSVAARVWEAAPGKGEFLVRVVERYKVHATGVDLSPYEIVGARERVAARVPGADVTLIEGDAAQHLPEPGLTDLAVCLGASWIWGGHRGTLEALRGVARPGGLVLVGEPFWMREPDPAYLADAEHAGDMFSTLEGNAEIGREVGLTLLYVLVSSPAEWDRFELLQLRAAERFAATHPDDPDVGELVARTRRRNSAYLRWGRDTLGWAIYLFRTPD
jgi:trans-aconitate methyltransferase